MTSSKLVSTPREAVSSTTQGLPQCATPLSLRQAESSVELIAALDTAHERLTRYDGCLFDPDQYGRRLSDERVAGRG